MSSATTMPLPALAFNHGSGMGSSVADFLSSYARLLPQVPTGVIVVEAHMHNDASGTVQVAGQTDLAARVVACLKQKNIASRISSARALQGAHGVADVMHAFKKVPVVALSVAKNGASARTSLRCGQALASLRENGVLIVGSGVPTFHNFSLLRQPQEVLQHSKRFDTWLTKTMSIRDTETRLRALSSWQQAPSARKCHPAHDTHFSPTLVVAGSCSGPGQPVHAESHQHILREAGSEMWKILRHFEFK